jgi:outer membrane protein TolC
MNSRIALAVKAWTMAIAAIALASSAAAQQRDTLQLNQMISEAISSHPTVMQAMEAVKIADSRIALSKSSYLPTVDGTASYSHIGPVPTINFSGMQFKMAPSDSYNAGVTVNQLVYDFGRTKNDAAIEEQNKSLAGITIEQAKQRIAASVVNAYLSLYYLQRAKDIKEEQLQTLSNHLEIVTKKRATGSATEYEILSTKVRMSNIESQRSDIVAGIKVQQAVLNTLMGRKVEGSISTAPSIPASIVTIPNDSLYSYAYENRMELRAASKKVEIAQMRLNLTKTQDNPTLAAFANGGVKNGYVPYLNDPKLNYAVGLTFKMPIFDGKRTINNTHISQSAINSSQYELEASRRAIAAEVAEAKMSLEAAKQKVLQFENQLQQAKRAMQLAETSYKVGTITNLDLLDAATALSESQLNLTKAHIDYCNSMYKIKLAIGEKLY